jgi:hypothetical protein
MVEASTRLKGVERLIDMNQYFVIHAARQSGKTTYLKDLAERLNAGGKYYALYCSLEAVQGIGSPEKGVPALLDCIVSALKKSCVPFIYDHKYETEKTTKPFIIINDFLTELSMALDKPLVILFDEADCLSEGTLISFLRQLRSGYNDRTSAPFVYSIALVGMRNIRDFKARIRPDSESLGSASPFNIVTEALTLKNFTKEEIMMLYQQHSDATGQIFNDDAIDLILQQTQGQPWLVNAIAREVIENILDSDYTRPITVELAAKAIQTIILRRDTHIDSLLERLKEPRVREVIEPMILGKDYTGRLSDNYSYVKDLGLIKDDCGKIEPANPIYGEVIARNLNYDIQQSLDEKQMEYPMPRYLKSGRIDMDYLLRDFQQFWRENSDIWVDKVMYREAAPHLILQAFFQRILNGGGQIIREFAIGTGRTDLCIVYDGKKYPIELKIWRKEKTLSEGIEQTARYMNTFGCTEGWLAIFDQRPEKTWDEKIYIKKESFDGKSITIVGL